MTAKIIPFNKAHSDVKCSFCETPKSKVKRMFSNGKDKHVCDKCIAKCKTLITESDNEN